MSFKVRDWLIIQVFSVQIDKSKGTFEEVQFFAEEIEHNQANTVLAVESEFRKALAKLDRER